MTEDDPRYLAMSPQQRASFDALSGGGVARPGRQYDPYDRGLFGGKGRRIDANHFGAMREYYTRAQRNAPPPTQHVGEAVAVPKKMLMLTAGPKLLAITQYASC